MHERKTECCILAPQRRSCVPTHFYQNVMIRNRKLRFNKQCLFIFYSGSASRNRPSSYRALFIQLHKEATERFTRSPNTVIATKHHPSNPFAPQTPPSGCDEKEAVSDGKTRQWIAALQGIVSQPSNMPWRRPLGN